MTPIYDPDANEPEYTRGYNFGHQRSCCTCGKNPTILYVSEGGSAFCIECVPVGDTEEIEE